MTCTSHDILKSAFRAYLHILLIFSFKAVEKLTSFLGNIEYYLQKCFGFSPVVISSDSCWNTFGFIRLGALERGRSGTLPVS